MIETGIPKLDEYLKGIPEGKSLLFQIQPGVEESNIGIHILHHNLEKGLKGIYISSESSPKNLEKSFSEFGWDIKKYNNLVIVDGYSPLIGAPSEQNYIVEEPHDIESYEEILQEIFEKEKNGIIVFDSLSNIMDMCGERKALEGIERINNEIKKEGFVAIYNFIAWPYKESIMYKIKKIFNAIIEVELIEDKIARQCMRIKKNDWGGNEGKRLEFKIFKPEGIRIYFPKICVIGPVRSGKTSFIRYISKSFVPVERLGTTVGIEYGIIDYKGYRAEVFGIPSHERFLPLIEKFLESAVGFILVIDSTKPEDFKFAKEMINKFGKVPYVIVANKQDLPNALRKKEIENMMGLDENVAIIEAVVKEGKGIFESFEILSEKILDYLNRSV